MGASSEHEVARVEDLSEPGSRVIVEIDGTEIAVFNVDGDFYAVANYCVHQAGPLCEGRITGRVAVGDDGWEWTYEDDGKIIECPWHQWKFDITTGDHIDTRRYRAPTYETKVRDGSIFVVR